MMKPHIKKKIKNLAITAAATAVIFSTLGVGMHYRLPEIVHYDNSSIQQTIELQEKLDAVTDYRQFNNERLQHNNDEPIYVRIGNDFTKEQRETIISALDYIFNIIGDINDNYKYEIVDEIDDGKYLGKTTIDFVLWDDLTFNGNNYNGLTDSDDSIFSYGSKGRFNQKCKIWIDKLFLENEEESLYYTSLHEALHNLGLADVYIQNKVQYRNTFMNPNTNTGLKMIPPNDYKLLVAMYAKDISKLSEDEKREYIKLLEQKIEDYTIKFYHHYAEVKRQSHKNQLLDMGYSQEDIEKNITYENLSNDLDLTFVDVVATREVSKIRIKVKGDKYVIATYDENYKLLENCSGKAYNIDGEIFLHDVHLKNFTVGLETYANLHIFSSKDSGVYRLSDTVDYTYCGTGRTTEYYNQQNQGLTQ